MEIKLEDLQIKTRELRTLTEFLVAIAVNKGLFWALHLATQLQKMQRLGIQSWTTTIGQEQMRPFTIKYKQSYGRGNQPYGVFSGQTRDQATFQRGYAELTKPYPRVVYTNIVSPEWVPVRGEKPWTARRGTDRPFWQYNGIYKFFNLSEYIDLESADQNIWKSSPNGQFTLTEAKKNLIMSTTQVRTLLNKKQLPLGSWEKGQAKGVARRWR